MKGITLMGKDGIGIAHQLDAIAPELGLSSAESLQVMNQLVWLNSAEQANGKYLGSAEKPEAFASVLKDSADFMEDPGATQQVPLFEVFQVDIYNVALGKSVDCSSFCIRKKEAGVQHPSLIALVSFC